MAVKCMEMLKENLLQPARALLRGRKLIFQRDIEPKHEAKSSLERLQKNNVNVWEWPNQSPDQLRLDGAGAALHISKEPFSVSRCTKLTQMYPRKTEALFPASGAYTGINIDLKGLNSLAASLIRLEHQFV